MSCNSCLLCSFHKSSQVIPIYSKAGWFEESFFSGGINLPLINARPLKKIETNHISSKA
jgi:hypothetical protein